MDKLQKIVTRKSMIDMVDLNKQPREKVIAAVGRALVFLYEQQTSNERHADSTLLHNDIGFTGADARSGSISARYYLAHGTLQDWVLDMWVKPNKRGVPRIAKYWKQLNIAANIKKERSRQQRLL